MQILNQNTELLSKMIVIWNSLDCLDHCDEEVVSICVEMVEDYGMDIDCLPDLLHEEVKNQIYLNREESYAENAYDALCYG